MMQTIIGAMKIVYTLYMYLCCAGTMIEVMKIVYTDMYVYLDYDFSYVDCLCILGL